MTAPYARYDSSAFESNGEVKVSGDAEVRVEDSDGNLATLYADRDGNNTLGNPFLADAEGRFSFYVDGGYYTVQVTSADASAQYTLKDQPVGTMQEQDADDVAITGGLVEGASLGPAPLGGDLDAGGTHTIKQLPAAVAAGDAVSKADLDAAINGLDWQESVIDQQGEPPISPTAGDRYLASYIPHPIVAVDTTNEVVEVDGDQTADFSVGDEFTINGSTGNDGTYTVASVTYNSTSGHTEITVNEDLTDATADGEVRITVGAWNGHRNEIAEYDGSAWSFITPDHGTALELESDGVYLIYNGTGWVRFGSAIDHNQLQGLQGGTGDEHYHLTQLQHGNVTQFAPGNLNTEYSDNADRLRQTEVDISGSSDVTLAEAQTTANIIRLFGSLTADIAVIVPDTPRRYHIIHDGSGGNVTVRTSAGTGITLSPGNQKLVRSNGTDVVDALDVTQATAGKDIGDLAQYEDDGSGNAVVDFPNPSAQKVQNLSFIPSHYNASGTHSGGGNTNAADRRTAKTPEGVELDIGGQSLILQAIQSLDLDTSSNWDDSTYATASNRAGKDFYLYYCQPSSGTEPDLILSANATVPSSMPSGDTPTEDNTRKVAGFHCLCADVGTISGHPLSGYIQGDILPDSVWDLLHKPNGAPEGSVYDAGKNRWVHIYLPSWDGSKMVSAYNATIADGASSPSFHWYNFNELYPDGWGLPFQDEFMSAALGSPEETNISGSADPGTTGGHSDTAGRRIISDIGCEDMTGVLWQWGAEAGAQFNNDTAYADADTDGTGGSYDDNNNIGRGQHRDDPTRPLLGGNWSDGSICGPRSSNWSGSPVRLNSANSARGVAEPAPAKR